MHISKLMFIIYSSIILLNACEPSIDDSTETSSVESEKENVDENESEVENTTQKNASLGCLIEGGYRALENKHEFCSPASTANDVFELTLDNDGTLLSVDDVSCTFLENSYTSSDDKCMDVFECGANSFVVTKLPFWGGGYTWMIAIEDDTSYQITCPEAMSTSSGNSSGDQCSSCLSSCSGLPGCCTGYGCICDDKC